MTKAEFVRAIPKLGIEAETFEIEQLFGFFDPDNDGVVRLQELHSALRKLDLGLSRSQLNQLVLSLGYTLGDEEVEPVEDDADSDDESDGSLH